MQLYKKSNHNPSSFEQNNTHDCVVKQWKCLVKWNTPKVYPLSSSWSLEALCLGQSDPCTLYGHDKWCLKLFGICPCISGPSKSWGWVAALLKRSQGPSSRTHSLFNFFSKKNAYNVNLDLPQKKIYMCAASRWARMPGMTMPSTTHGHISPPICQVVDAKSKWPRSYETNQLIP